MNENKTPHPWRDFLEARKHALKWMRDEMHYDHERIAYEMSMDATQVRLILQHVDEQSKDSEEMR